MLPNQIFFNDDWSTAKDQGSSHLEMDCFKEFFPVTHSFFMRKDHY